MKSPFFTLTLTLFLLMDALGNIPVFLAFLKNIPPRKRRYIILREMAIALFVMILFAFFGDNFLTAISVSESSVYITGGIILFIIGLKMLFPGTLPLEQTFATSGEPFIIPLAIPFVAGPAVLAALMIYAKANIPPLILVAATFLAWLLSCILFLSSTGLYKILGDKGIKALENLMGLILLLMAVQMFLNGVHHYTTTKHTAPIHYNHQTTN